MNQGKRQIGTGADRTRAILNSLKNQKGVIATQSYLRLEQPLKNQGSVTFDVLTNQGQPTPTERRLNLPDSFLITAVALMIYKTTATLTNARATLRTWPNPVVWAGVGEAAAMNAMYNGYFSIRVNSVVYIDSLDTFRFYRVGVAQQGLNISAVAPGAYAADTYERGDFPFYGLTPGIKLSGATKNELTLTLPDSENMTAPVNEVNYAVCYLRGILLQNAAQFNARG